MSEKSSKGRFLKPEKLQNHSNKGNGKDKRKSEEKEKKLLDAKGPFGDDNVFKNPDRRLAAKWTVL